MDPLLLRFMERLAVVLIGGMAIYLGYRLFLKVPEQHDSAGKVVLPWDVSIVVTRVGPGVFFALFGAVAVSAALVSPLELNNHGGATVRYGSALMEDSARLADARALLRREMATLNALPQMLDDGLPGRERESVRRGLTRVKLALLRAVWDADQAGFGPYERFEAWVQNGEPDPPPDGMHQALALYRYGEPPP